MQNGMKIACEPDPEVRSRILLVEDDVYVAKFIHKRLIVEGFEVEVLSDGAEALEAIRSKELPDLIITDLRMPKMDGFELLEQIRKIDKASSVPVVILSGTATVEERVECLDRGARDYLCKPIDGSELAARVRVHLRNSDELRRLRKEARFDPLTGCLNRRGTTEALQREIDRADRAHSPLTLMLIDADKFKDINDGFGHAAGDVVLIELANTLKECLRLTDVVGRLGGDEFIIALPSVDEPLATEIKNRLRERVAQNTVPGTDHAVSISIGLVVDSTGQYNLEELFAKADQAMYADKNRRRRILTSIVAVAPEIAVQESTP